MSLKGMKIKLEGSDFKFSYDKKPTPEEIKSFMSQEILAIYINAIEEKRDNAYAIALLNFMNGKEFAKAYTCKDRKVKETLRTVIKEIVDELVDKEVDRVLNEKFKEYKKEGTDVVFVSAIHQNKECGVYSLAEKLREKIQDKMEKFAEKRIAEYESKGIENDYNAELDDNEVVRLLNIFDLKVISLDLDKFEEKFTEALLDEEDKSVINQMATEVIKVVENEKEEEIAEVKKLNEEIVEEINVEEKNIETPKVVEDKKPVKESKFSEEDQEFFDKVKAFTNNFQFLTDTGLIREGIYGTRGKTPKFSSIDEFQRFYEIQKMVVKEMSVSGKNESVVIGYILNKTRNSKNKGCYKIDDVAKEILTFRKNVLDKDYEVSL